MAFVTDNAFEIELNKMIALADAIKREENVLMSTFSQMPQKDKVQHILKITNSIKQIQSFLSKSKTDQIFNSGIKFKIENLKSRLFLIQTMWKKIEQRQ
ncbi:MAG: hypothetical protein IPM57_04400 [Oligoflexia bacterium]|nr:hypothetical protein [Oligoflexia bacterium]